MPELPEVETIARGLNSLLTGRCFDHVLVLYSGCLKSDPEMSIQKIVGNSVTKVWRRGKLLIIDLEADLHLVFHLKMTGKVLFKEYNASEVDKHTHLVFTFSDASQLHYQDIRKFGYCRLIQSQAIQDWPFFAGLGPEPLDLDSASFRRILQGRQARLKSVLLDQTCIAGIGNIYADESLFLAGLHPASPCSILRSEDYSRLLESLRHVLLKAVRSGGSSFSDYVNSLGKPGSYQNHFLVYGRSGGPCKQCGEKLQSVKVAGRTSVFCPCCQKLETKFGDS